MRVFGTRGLSLLPLARPAAHATPARRVFMGTMSSSHTGAAIVSADASQLLTQIHTQLHTAFHRDGRGLQALSRDEIAPLRELCDQLQPEHFKLSVPTPLHAPQQTSSKRRNRVRYQHIFENHLFSMGIFILPPGASIPLHDHPGMSVISRVLYGRLHVTSCDLVPSKEASHLFWSSKMNSSPVSPGSSDASSTRRIARIFGDDEILAPYTTELLPDEGNLHEFVADPTLGCAIFDILTPPYDPENGRDCTYYRFMSGSKTSENGREYVELEEFEPHDFEVVSETYHGPRLPAAPF